VKRTSPFIIPAKSLRYATGLIIKAQRQGRHVDESLRCMSAASACMLRLSVARQPLLADCFQSGRCWPTGRGRSAIATQRRVAGRVVPIEGRRSSSRTCSSRRLRSVAGAGSAAQWCPSRANVFNVQSDLAQHVRADLADGRNPRHVGGARKDHFLPAIAAIITSLRDAPR